MIEIKRDTDGTTVVHSLKNGAKFVLTYKMGYFTLVHVSTRRARINRRTKVVVIGSSQRKDDSYVSGELITTSTIMGSKAICEFPDAVLTDLFTSLKKHCGGDTYIPKMEFHRTSE